jgi:hypothetical protein
MPTEKIVEGPHFTIHGWIGQDGKCGVLDFLDELESHGNPAHERLMWLLDRTANNGIPTNVRQVRSLDDEIYEFKGNVRRGFFSFTTKAN